MKNTVGVISSQGLIAIHKKETLERGYNVMKRISTRHLPVIDDDGTIVGMISDRDFQRAMIVPESHQWSALEDEPRFNPSELVMEYMSWPIQAVDESTSVTKAAEQMIQNKISSLIVTRNRHAIGIVSTEDLLKALIASDKSPLTALKDEVTASIYNSPVGSVAQLLSNIGI